MSAGRHLLEKSVFALFFFSFFGLAGGPSASSSGSGTVDINGPWRSCFPSGEPTGTPGVPGTGGMGGRSSSSGVGGTGISTVVRIVIVVVAGELGPGLVDGIEGLQRVVDGVKGLVGSDISALAGV